MVTFSRDKRFFWIPALSFLSLGQSHQTPNKIVSTVSGAPTLKYAQNPMVTPCALARCATIRLANDPTSVKLPASVEAMATTSHARWGSC